MISNSQYRSGKSKNFRHLLEQPDVLVIPSVYDCVSLLIAERIGFKAASNGGFNTAASYLGLPDIGLLTMTETVSRGRYMASVVSIPLLWDADDGYGDVNNVMRTTHEFIRAGIAAMLIEDQVNPKRCPSLGGNRVISMEDMIRKIHAVKRVREKEDPSFVIVARTHASLAIGLDEGIRRGIAYAQEGADIIFIDHGYDDSVINDLNIMAEKVGPYAHLLANMTENVGRPLLTNEELHDMGFKIVLYSLSTLMASAAATELVLKEIMEKGTTKGIIDRMMPVNEFTSLLRIDEIRKLEQELATEQ